MKISIKLRIAIWFAIVTATIVVFSFWLIFSFSKTETEQQLKDTLQDVVYDNIDSFTNEFDDDYFDEYYDDYDESVLDRSTVLNRIFDILSDNFKSYERGVKVGVYSDDGEFLMGSNRISDEPFEPEIREIFDNGEKLFIFDEKINIQQLQNIYNNEDISGLGSLWMRGTISASTSEAALNSFETAAIWVLPILLIIAIAGGCIIVYFSLNPIKKITETASQISSGDDLHKRINIKSNAPEVRNLTDTFNNMFIKLNESFDMQKQFISDASHELRTPMSVIMAQCDYSLSEEQTNQEYIDAIKMIKKQGRNMSNIIDGILELSRIENNSDRYKKEVLDFSEAVKLICFDMKLIREKNIELNYEVEDEIKINGDRALISRLLTNLISNSYRYGNENGYINVKLKKEDSSAVLSVEDNGVGIAQNDIDKIFDRFYQADSSRGSSGNGLGLSMVKDIAKWHGGTVSVESELNKGSKFIVKIPAL